MAKIETYSDFDNKDVFFKQININSKERLDKQLETYKKEQKKFGLVFRGVVEAKYKLYNSAQRKWLNLELNNFGYSYKEFIQKEISNAKNWQNKLLEKFFTAFGQPPYDISVLSFLQHYGAPTPLLDWTYSFENALFFATEGLSYTDSNNQIDNYCSVYIIDTRWKGLINYLEFVQSALNEIDRILESNSKVNADKEISKLKSFNYQSLHELRVAQIPGYKRKGFAFSLKSRPSFNLIWNQQNLNIINQKGLFIYNYSENLPLEAFFQTNKILAEAKNPLYTPQIICLNIHKSLFEYIKFKLTKGKQFPIDKEFIYPQEEVIANKTFIHFLNHNFL